MPAVATANSKYRRPSFMKWLLVTEGETALEASLARQRRYKPHGTGDCETINEAQAPRVHPSCLVPVHIRRAATRRASLAAYLQIVNAAKEEDAYSMKSSMCGLLAPPPPPHTVRIPIPTLSSKLTRSMLPCPGRPRQYQP